MFTVKVTYTTAGMPITDLIECVSPRITEGHGGHFVYIHGGAHDGEVFYVGEGPKVSQCPQAHTIVIENAAGKTTEIFRDHRDIMAWRKDMEAQKTAEAA
jgi:hypothetical protein